MKKHYGRLLLECERDQYDRIRTSETKSKYWRSICREITGKTINKDSTLSGYPHESANNYSQLLLNTIPNLLSNLPINNFKCDTRFNNIYVDYANTSSD